MEEVPQAQIEAEEKLQKETEQRETLERTVSDLNGQVESLTGPDGISGSDAGGYGDAA